MGIAKFVMRDVQHLAAIEAIDDALVLSILRFADELVDASQLSFPSGKNIRKKELDMATSLVEHLAAEWQPDKYKDDYRENLMRVIKAKVRGKPAELVTEEVSRDSNVVDLMERLRRSLEGAGARSRKASHAKATARSKKKPARRRAA